MRRRILPCFAALACLLLLAGTAWSATSGQTHFSAHQEGPQWRFDYGWIDQSGTHTLRFRLDAEAIAAARRGFRAYRRADLEEAADAERDRQATRAVADLERAHPGIELELKQSGSIQWRTKPPADFAERQQDLFRTHMDQAIATVQADYPQARISRGEDGALDLSARSKKDLAAIQQRLAEAQRAANQAVADYADQVQTQIERRSERLGQDLRSEFAAVQQRMDTFKLAYFRERLYRLDESGTLFPDYARIGERALPALAPLAQAMSAQVQGLSTRTALNTALAFIQTIPYDRLLDRANDAGFLPPVVMLADNRGDCDTKSVAFAALTHLLYPHIPSALVLVPNHAFLALGLDPAPGDRLIRHHGRDWVLAEPVGPGTPPVGAIGDESSAALHQVTAVIPLFP